MINNKLNKTIRLVGHPYSPIGMGDHVRCTFRAMREAAIQPTLTDIYKLSEPEAEQLLEFSRFCSEKPADINIFHINGDEVDQSLAHLSEKNFSDSYNIIYPAWELSNYPHEWALQLDRFDEIWAPSGFIKESIEKACKKTVIHMPLACEVALSSFLSRRYFGVPEEDYVFLFFFDVRSYVARKNPHAVIESFRKLLDSRPYSKARLLLKVNGADMAPDILREIQKDLTGIESHVTILHRTMTDNEAKNLVRCCDCFVSLHRSEGFGKGLSEAMVLGKPVIATGYSGNMEFMNSEVSFPVPYNLIQLTEGQYPHFENQVWADADVTEATSHMIKLLDKPEIGRAIGIKARLHMQNKFSYRTIGFKYRSRLEEIGEH